MAYELELSAKFDSLTSGLQKVRDGLQTIKQDASRASNNITTAFRETGSAMSGIAGKVRETAQALASVSTPLTGVKQSFADTAASADLLSAGIDETIVKVNQLASATINEASAFSQGSGKKQQALQNEIAELQRLQSLSKAANNPESVKEFTRVIELQTQKVKELTKEIQGKRKFDITFPDGTLRSVSSMKTLLREAETEAFSLGQKFGFTSKEAVEARRRVAEFRDAINDARAGVDAFNPDKKFAAATQTLTALLGGFTALQGALGLIGVEGEDAQQALVKIQSAMAISQGLSQFLNLGDALKNVRSLFVQMVSAQAASTVATNASTGSIAANTVAQVANTQATRTGIATQGIFRTAILGATTAVRALTASLLSNPFTAIAVAVGAIVVALISMGKEAKFSADEVEKATDRILKLKDIKIADSNLKKELADLKVQIAEVAAGDDVKKRIELSKQLFLNELANIKERENILISSNMKLQTQFFELENLKQKAGKTELENIKKAQEGIQQKAQAIASELDRIEEQRKTLDLRQELAAKRLGQELIAQEKRLQEERNRVITQAAEELFKSEEELRKKAQQESINKLTGEQRIMAERQVAIEEVREFEKGLKIKEKLFEESQKKISEQKLTKLINIPEALRTDEQRAEIDRLIADVKLKTKDVAAIGLILDGIERQFAEKLQAFYSEQAELRLDLIDDSTTREAEEFRIGLEKKIKELRASGVKEDEIEQFKANKQRAFKQKQALEDISQQQEISLKEVEAMKVGANEVFRTEEDKQIALLNIKAFYTKEALKAIEGDTSKEAAVQRATLKATLSNIESQLLEFRQKIGTKPITWATIFNFKGSEKEVELFNQNMNKIADNVLNITSQIIQSAQSGVQAQISANQEIIRSLDDRINETQSAISKEEELNKQGVANNLALKRGELEALKRQKAEALENEKRLRAEQARLAKLQVIADSAEQASSLSVAAANLIKNFSKMPFGLGIAVAFGLITSMIATFLSFKARMTSAAQQAVNFGEGGVLPHGIVKGKSHREGGVRVGDSNIFVEGGEYITRKRSTEKYYDLLEAINKDDFSKIHYSTITNLPKFNHPNVSRETVTKIYKEGKEAEVRVMVNALKADELKHGIALLDSTVRDVADRIMNKEQTTILSDGSRIIQRGNVTTIIRPK